MILKKYVRLFSQLSKKMNLKGFLQERILGQGTYGCVYKAKRISDGKSYAVKVINLGKLIFISIYYTIL